MTTHIDREYNLIASSLISKEVGFLFGAGMSVGTGIKPPSEIAELLLMQATHGETHTTVPDSIKKQATLYPFEAIAEYMTSMSPTHNIADFLNQACGFAGAKPHDGHAALLNLRLLLKGAFPPILYTTNFDELIEAQFTTDDSTTVTESTIEELRVARREGKVAIAHLHGSISRPDTLLVGEKSIAAARGALLSLFNAEISKDVFVLVGYSLSDTNLRKIFFEAQELASARKQLAKRTYIVSPYDGDPHQIDSPVSVASEIWKQRGATLIPTTAADFFKRLLAACNTKITFDIRQRVAARLSIDVDALDVLLKRTSDTYELIRPEDLLVYLYYSFAPWGEQ